MAVTQHSLPLPDRSLAHWPSTAANPASDRRTNGSDTSQPNTYALASGDATYVTEETIPTTSTGKICTSSTFGACMLKSLVCLRSLRARGSTRGRIGTLLQTTPCFTKPLPGATLSYARHLSKVAVSFAKTNSMVRALGSNAWSTSAFILKRRRKSGGV